MATPQSPTLYEQVITVTSDYLGPASERFVSRQIRNHLNKDPADLTRKDLAQLIRWIKATISVLTEDAEIANSYIADLTELTKLKGRTT
ncbi:MAG: hypothetical protein JWM37_265 [Candidatus Saccharibacteria bacterium]|nr:hypothetical protein [Candidatus Saccharibacteria bacterium]